MPTRRGSSPASGRASHRHRRAQGELEELRRRLDVGQDVDSKQTVGEWLEQWLAGKVNLRATTRRSYRQHIDDYLIPQLGSIPWSGFAPPTSLRCLPLSRSGRVGPVTARRVHATLRSALNAAVKQQRIMVNPAVHVELPR